MICRALGRHDEAREHLQEAVEVFRSHRVPFEVARTRLELALLAHDTGDAAETAAQLRESYRAFQELCAQRYVERAEQAAQEDWEKDSEDDSCCPGRGLGRDRHRTWRLRGPALWLRL